MAHPSTDRRGHVIEPLRFSRKRPKPPCEQRVFGIGARLGNVAIGEILAGDGRERPICRDIALRRRALRNCLSTEEVRQADDRVENDARYVHPPLEGWRRVKVTDRHAAADYAQMLKELSDVHFP